MLTLTAEAIEAIESIAKQQTPPRNVVRIGVSSDQFSMNFEDHPADGDAVLDHGAFSVVIDPDSVKRLEKVTLDYVKTPRQAGFKFHDPDAKPPKPPEPPAPPPAKTARSYVQSMPTRIYEEKELEHAAILSTIQPGDVAFRYDQVDYEATVERVNSTSATVRISGINGTPNRQIGIGDKVYIGASVLARGRPTS